METKFQTSFIPKTTIAPTAEFRPRRQTSLLLVSSFFLFLISVLLGGLAFGYEKFLLNEKANITNIISENVKKFQEDTIRKYARLDQKIDNAKSLIEKHVALSYFLDFLSKETLKSVRFLDMAYTLSPDGKSADIQMNAQASGYNAVAYQSTVFGKQSSLKNIIFSGLDLDKAGNVVFKLAFKLDLTFVYYKKNAADFLKQSNNTVDNLEAQVD